MWLQEMQMHTTPPYFMETIWSYMSPRYLDAMRIIFLFTCPLLSFVIFYTYLNLIFSLLIIFIWICNLKIYFSNAFQVFSCVSGTCGHFYHPECVAKKLHPEDEVQAKVLQTEIAAGESFTCPLHKCYLCKQLEVKKDHELQFAICRRCPKAYHRKCLPK